MDSYTWLNNWNKKPASAIGKTQYKPKTYASWADALFRWILQKGNILEKKNFSITKNNLSEAD